METSKKQLNSKLNCLLNSRANVKQTMHQITHFFTTTLFKPVDNFLNYFTMYKVILGGLSLIAGLSLILALFGLLPFTFAPAIISLLTFILGNFGLNFVLGKLLDAPINLESAAITGLILYLIFSPPTTAQGFLMTLTAIIVAMTSKYVFAIHKKHLFNPAAIAALIVMVIGFEGVSWWVATPVLFPALAIVALLVVRKIRRFSLFGAFALAALASILYHNLASISSGITTLPELFAQVLLSWPLLFFGSIMLTEPYTMPPTKRLQLVFGVLVGLLFGARFHIGPFFATPEFALIVGNIFAYIVSPKQKLFLTVKAKRKLSESIYEFAFTRPASQLGIPPFSFKAGQYLEWTIPMETAGLLPDSRGNRRFFTIASSPTEKEILLGVKIPEENPSYFKKALVNLKKDDCVVGGQLAGDFTLQLSKKSNQSELVFIAGGIGVTPFRSMTKYLIDMAESKQLPADILPKVTLLYCGSTPDDLVYQDVFTEASKKIKFNPVYVLTRPESKPKNWQGETGRLTPEIITKHIAKPTQATFYLSGPNAMVHAYKKLLVDMQVPTTNIKEDYFPGF